MTTPRIYYNEHDPQMYDWLCELIRRGVLPPGDVDDADIQDLTPEELLPYDQCHFFAGIGGWVEALRLTDWPASRKVWTGSCPCQPFSAAGKQRGKSDERHLWPYWYRLIAKCRPPVIFGEQVENAIAHGWLDLVSADLEREDYAVGAVVLPAASVGAPHGRHRLWFVADRERDGWGEERPIGGRVGQGDSAEGWAAGSQSGGDVGGVADAAGDRGRDGQSVAQRGTSEFPTSHREAGDVALPHGAQHDGRGAAGQRRRLKPTDSGFPGCGCWDRCAFHRTVGMWPEEVCINNGAVGHHHHPRPQGQLLGLDGPGEWAAGTAGVAGEMGLPYQRNAAQILPSVDTLREQRSPIRGRTEFGSGTGAASRNGSGDHPEGAAGSRDGEGPRGVGDFWSPVQWLPCRDGKFRPVEPGTFPLAHGVPARVGRLRGYGNAIVPQVAAEVILAYREVRGF